MKTRCAIATRSYVVALLAIAVFLFSEQRARAESASAALAFNVLGGTAAGVASVPFLVADVVYAVQGRWLPRSWATSQIVFGGTVDTSLAVVGMAMAFSDCSQSCRETVLPLTIGAGVLGVGFIAHGVASLVWYRSPEPTKDLHAIGIESHSAHLRWSPDILVTRDGARLVAFSGTF